MIKSLICELKKFRSVDFWLEWSVDQKTLKKMDKSKMIQ